MLPGAKIVPIRTADQLAQNEALQSIGNTWTVAADDKTQSCALRQPAEQVGATCLPPPSLCGKYDSQLGKGWHLRVNPTLCRKAIRDVCGWISATGVSNYKAGAS